MGLSGSESLHCAINSPRRAFGVKLLPVIMKEIWMGCNGVGSSAMAAIYPGNPRQHGGE